ncbi:MAG TPA: tol-pal system protein YbgF [Gammaproteobacteria bacterium]|jgi:tol-pal system protein YbgF|nr:tol-pal system protein YbgF [Gammaproteobacteria bacterium]
MQKLKLIISIAGLAALIGAASPIFAEPAPVFDADTFDANADAQDQDYPMPPSPGDEAAADKQSSQTDGAIVSGQSQQAPDQSQSQGFQPANQVSDKVGAVGSNAASGSDSTAQQPAGAGAANQANDSVPASGVGVSTENLSPDQRMRRLEQQINNLQSSQSAAHVESLQNEVQSLRGQVEQLNHQIDTMRTTDKTKGADMDVQPAGVGVAAVQKPDSKKAAAATAATIAAKPPASKKKSPHASEADELSSTTAVSSNGQPNVAEEQQIYQTAYDLIKAKKYNEAVDALQGMLKKYPSGQFASNAHYWLGELYNLMGKNDNALDEFTTVVNKFPDSPRVGDAQLKVGLILAAQSKWSDAKKAFKTVINTYPGTAPAKLASEQLKQIKLAGH